MLRFLVVGLGAIGQRHVRNLRALYGDEIEILAYRARGMERIISDRLDIEAEAGLHTRYKIQAYYDLSSALATQPDAALICNPSSYHIETALCAADAGCHLFIEKPLAHSLEGVNELRRRVEAKHLTILVGFQMRFHPCLRAARELLARNELGRVVAVRAVVGEYLPNWHRYEDYRATYGARRELGGGAVISQIHEFDYLYWFFGMPRRLWTVGGHLSDLEIDVEDVASTLMAYAREGHEFPVHLQQDYLQRPAARRCEIVGETGKVDIDLVAPSLRQYDGRGQLVQTLEFPNWARNELFLAEMEHFVRCVRGEATPAVDLETGVASLRMAMAAQESLLQGRVVEL